VQEGASASLAEVPLRNEQRGGGLEPTLDATMEELNCCTYRGCQVEEIRCWGEMEALRKWLPWMTK
jgi:hypothetical protein